MYIYIYTRLVRDNFSVPLWVIGVSMCQSIKNQHNKYTYGSLSDEIVNLEKGAWGYLGQGFAWYKLPLYQTM